MPNITIDGPKLEDVEKKRKLVREVTQSVFEAYGIPKEHIVVTLQEHSSHNVATGGVLISDKHKE